MIRKVIVPVSDPPPGWISTALRPFLATARVLATAPMDGGIGYFLGSYVIRFFRMYLLLGIWKSVWESQAVAAAADLGSLFWYTIISSAFYRQVNVVTTASSTLWEGSVGSRYIRPSGVFTQYAAETVGLWLADLLFFTLPVLLLASPLARTLGVTLAMPDLRLHPWFVLSLGLGVSAGFALDFVFTGVMIWFGEMHYAAYQIRGAVSALLSGALIPFYLLPEAAARLLELLPFATMASAPLQIITGTGSAARLVPLQAFWCLVLWPCAALIWRRNRQRLVIFGG